LFYITRNETSTYTIFNDIAYTRSSDSVTWNSSNEIQERINIANNAKSDLLVTISCNIYTSETTNGIETFYLKSNAKGKQLAEYI
jgi:N-acetylmuramoyl-L-alanine amidase